MPLNWIHPSYRDLVVEQLAEDGGLRSTFLRMMDLEGVKLAVSQAGGATGARVLPLLRTAEDWESLADRCTEIAKAGDTQNALALIRVLSSATVDLETSSNTRLKGILGVCCSIIKDMWNERAQAIKHAELREYFATSVLVEPLPISPKLGPTWQSATSKLRTTIRDSMEGSDVLDADAISEWVSLAHLLTSNEPRFMRQVGFPIAFVGDVAQLLVAINKECELEPDFERAEDLWAESERFDTLLTSLQDLVQVFADLKDQIAAVELKVSEQVDYLQQRSREGEPDDDRDWDGGERGAPMAHFDWQTIFNDL
jgi:hypothetical protein